MRRADSHQRLNDDEKQEMCRKLRDKYIDKFGYTKKIVIDDCLAQFARVHDTMPNALALKELDIIMKKRVMGKDVQYTGPSDSSLKPKGVAASQPNLGIKNLGVKASKNGGIIGKAKDDKVIDMKIAPVTGKITSLPAPKLKRRAKQPEEPTVNESSQNSAINEQLLDAILKGEASDPRNPNKKVNHWGLIDMYKGQQYENDLKQKSERKKEIAAEYKKQLDEQMGHIKMFKKMEEIENKAAQLKVRGKNFSNNPVDEKTLLSEYDSLTKEMEKSNVLQARGVSVGKPPKSEQEKVIEASQYKDILDRQMIDKSNSKVVEQKDKEFYKNLYKQAGDDFENKNKEKLNNKKLEHEKYSRLLDEQLQLKRKIQQQEMNDDEFKLNKDIISKASMALYKS